MRIRESHDSGLRYIALEPEGYDGSHSYPMVILLHGFGSHMRDLANLCPSLGHSDYVYICPNAPISIPLGHGMNGFAWAQLDSRMARKQMTDSQNMIQSFVREVMLKYRVSPGDVVLGGFSQGGMMAYNCGLVEPTIFRGILILSSRIVGRAGLKQRLPLDRSQPIFIAHGIHDEVIPVADARKSLQFLKDESYNPQYMEYEIGHEINQAITGDVSRWLHEVLPAESRVLHKENGEEQSAGK